MTIEETIRALQSKKPAVVGTEHQKGFKEGIEEAIRYLLTDTNDKTSSWIYNKDGMDYGIGAWQCEKCGCNNSMIPTYIRMPEGKQDITHENINPYAYAGTRFCGNCGRIMVK